MGDQADGCVDWRDVVLVIAHVHSSSSFPLSPSFSSNFTMCYLPPCSSSVSAAAFAIALSSPNLSIHFLDDKYLYSPRCIFTAAGFHCPPAKAPVSDTRTAPKLRKKTYQSYHHNSGTSQGANLMTFHPIVSCAVPRRFWNIPQDWNQIRVYVELGRFGGAINIAVLAEVLI